MPSRSPNILWLIHREGLASIFASCYLTSAAMLAARGYSTQMVVFSAPGEWLRPALRRRWRRLAREVRAQVPGGLVRLPSPPSRVRNAWNEAAFLRHWLRRRFGQQRLVLHCPGESAALLAMEARCHLPQLRVIHYYRGPAAAEYVYQFGLMDPREAVGNVRCRAEVLEAEQAAALRGADAIVCISAAMIEHAAACYGVPREKTVLLPSCVDIEHFGRGMEKRAEVRAELGLEDRLVVAFCGSMFAFQRSDRIVSLFTAIRERVPPAHFLALTTSPNAMRELLHREDVGKTDYTVLSVPHAEVPRWLAAADLGIIGRGLGEGASLVNEISSPLKFGEYLACGVPVIMSEGVGDFSQLAHREGVGVVVPHGASVEETARCVADFVAAHRRDPDALRSRARRTAVEHLNYASHVPALAACSDLLLAR